MGIEKVSFPYLLPTPPPNPLPEAERGSKTCGYCYTKHIGDLPHRGSNAET